uniref:Saposin B-type domain-containing protein n=1 Tax=Ascaris lumbricoides TaxID=6252 RepID=A0A0M3HWW5_ASCLU
MVVVWLTLAFLDQLLLKRAPCFKCLFPQDAPAIHDLCMILNYDIEPAELATKLCENDRSLKCAAYA